MAKTTKKETEDIKEVTETKVKKETTKKAPVTTSGFSVSDPEIARPKELPLILIPDDGVWKNDAQAEYAKTLNGYAYKNPEKWKVKKEDLLERLAAIGEDPSLIVLERGNIDPNKRFEYGGNILGN